MLIGDLQGVTALPDLHVLPTMSDASCTEAFKARTLQRPTALCTPPVAVAKCMKDVIRYKSNDVKEFGLNGTSPQ